MLQKTGGNEFLSSLGRWLACALFLLIIFQGALFVRDARAGTIEIAVDRNSVTLNINLELRENLTALPQIHVYLDMSNSTPAVTPIQAAIQKLVPGSRVSSLRLSVLSKPPVAPSTLWVLRENYTIVVIGGSVNSGGEVSSNLAFVSLNVSDPVRLGGGEINRVGSAYLLQPLKNAPTFQTGYFFSGRPFGNSNIPGNATDQFAMLDLTWIPPVSEWTLQSGPSDSSTRWRVQVPSSSFPVHPYNLTIGLRPIENTFLQVLVAILDPSVTLVAPARAWAVGRTIFFNLPTSADALMPAIVGLSLATVIVSFLLDRRLTRTVRFKKKAR